MANFASLLALRLSVFHGMSALAFLEDGKHFAMAGAVVPLWLPGDRVRDALWLYFLYRMARLHGWLVVSTVVRYQEDTVVLLHAPNLRSKLGIQLCVHFEVHQPAKLQNLTVWLHGLTVHILQKLRKKVLFWSLRCLEKWVTCRALQLESYALSWLVSLAAAPNCPQNGVPFVMNDRRWKTASA